MNNGLFARLNNRPGHYTVLLLAGSLVFLVNLGGPSLWDLDEGRNATAAYEMMSGGDWITPTFNSELRVDKPALLYWLQILAYYVFGVCEFSARLPSALAGLAAVLVCYELGRRMFSATTGLLAGLILASSPMMCAAARFANPDSLLNLFTLLTLAIFWTAYDSSQKSTAPRKWFSAPGIIGIGAASALAVLAKGPVGLVLPAAVALLFLLWNRQPGALLNRRVMLGVWTFLLVAAPWYILVTVDSKGEFAQGFIMKHNVQRFSSTMESHRGGPLYYLFVVMIGTAPWSVFLLSSICYSFRAVFRVPQETTPAYRLLYCWIATYMLFFSLSATKLPNYILPIYPAVALLIGSFFERWCGKTLILPRWHMPLSLSEIALIGAVLGTGLMIGGGAIELSALRGRFLPGLDNWWFIGLALIAGAASAWWFCLRGNHHAAVGSIAVAAIATMTSLAAWGLTAIEGSKAVRSLVTQAGAHQPQREIIVSCVNLEYLPSFNFYCQRDVRHCRSDREALQLLRHPQAVFLFLPEKKWAAMAARVTTPHRVLGKCRDLYKNADIVVVSNLR